MAEHYCIFWGADKMQLNLYDFDKTIYDGDSTIDFYKFCLKKTRKVLLSLPKTVSSLVLYIFGVYSKTQFKEKFFSFLKYFDDDINEYIEEFWDKNYKKIKPWYLSKCKNSDVIISASPEFLLLPICNRLNTKLIASKVDKKTGTFQSENCYGEEKLKRLNSEINEYTIEEFYSDSISDKPLATLAKYSYFVKGNKIDHWEKYNQGIFSKIKSTFLTLDFLLFIFCGGVGTLSNFLFSLLISTRIDPTISYVFGYSLSLFITYSLNTLLIFKRRLSAERFLRFILSYIPNFLILFTFVYLNLNVFRFHKAIVYAMAGLLGLPITFILVKIIAFSKSRKNGGK